MGGAGKLCDFEIIIGTQAARGSGGILGGGGIREMCTANKEHLVYENKHETKEKIYFLKKTEKSSQEVLFSEHSPWLLGHRTTKSSSLSPALPTASLCFYFRFVVYYRGGR